MKNHQLISIIVCLLLSILVLGCTKMKTLTQEEKSQRKYFKSPEESIPVISDLLTNQDFKILATYYDLSSSKLNRTFLESGDFFIRKERPEVAHPAGFWRYKHPFTPGFKFHSMQPTEKESVYLVRMVIEIDQGSEYPSQQGFSEFYMIKSLKGWQILPDGK